MATNSNDSGILSKVSEASQFEGIFAFPTEALKSLSSCLAETTPKHPVNSDQSCTLEVFQPESSSWCPLTLYSDAVAAGAPLPAGEYSEGKLDLNRYLLRNPAATFFVRVNGDSMIDAGIHPDDLLVVDRSIPPLSGKIVIAVVNGDLTVKRLFREKGRLFLVPENTAYPTLEITTEMDFMIWGVVTNVIHPV